MTNCRNGGSRPKARKQQPYI